MDGVNELDMEVLKNIMDQVAELENRNIEHEKYTESQMIDKIVKIIKREVDKNME
ncbi:hypothetical protein SAMN02745671_00873 [Anaerovibrio lipolyticus DSM 3074]|uniref:Uncharacterized protein n=1 Tax=Anaerovibrio lipolyticus DSM 3074 TaxID=1120997 RepID=A0A1M6BWS4_9FIRM|nr:hypothetical protein [Anaerovibrio lipolyticus]SHI52974.1 hypothetical protein SAMN02745671_00873 [Anaerovibrio lipolyticus DSM 3074]